MRLNSSIVLTDVVCVPVASTRVTGGAWIAAGEAEKEKQRLESAKKRREDNGRDKTCDSS